MLYNGPILTSSGKKSTIPPL